MNKDHDNAAFRSHDLVEDFDGCEGVRYERRPCPGADGLRVVWITLDNQAQYNSYTTEIVKGVIHAFRRASNERDVAAVVFTGAGDRAFCTGGNTAEYSEYYAGRPDEYLQYMRLFNDMVTGILHCDRPVICRVNGMRIAGGQEIGMACDFSVASDLAVFGQAGPRHGSAPDGGSTDFLPLFVGMERGMQSATLCESWTAYQAVQLGLITEAVPVLRVNGDVLANPLVITDRWLEGGQPVWGLPKTGDELAAGKALLRSGEIDLAPLDRAVAILIEKLVATFPGCTRKTIESMRKHKLALWDRNRETNRSWLGLNMLGEAAAGFRAFHEGPKGRREVDFADLRRRLAAGERWTPEFIDSLIPTEAADPSLCTAAPATEGG
ncbi:MAG: 6-oxocyclohex-1-ene-1-carbonyl-CoA hydratase [Myxococcota bacterium]|jgi:6-oxo-cyclohex-1-ene-carbonyl-CoA hydrolase|nr:6-oxocyclohex-1-ene-1-carbonyl-CoA hydratase [Myxococcota bacterium]